MNPLDTVLDAVPAAYHVAGPANLPGPVQAQYNTAKVWLRDQTAALGLDDSTVAIGVGAVTAVSAMVSGSPEAAMRAALGAVQAGLILCGGPIGMAAAAGIAIFEAIMDNLPQASGGAYADPCLASGARWYGGWNLTVDVPPTKGSDRWLSWRQPASRVGPAGYLPPTDAIRMPTRCCDDTPAVPNPPGVSVGTFDGAVSGAFTWLPATLTAAAPGSFEAMYWGLVANALELYINAAGPRVDADFLSDLLRSSAQGWNAIHDPGDALTISADDWPTMAEGGFGGQAIQVPADADTAVLQGRNRLDAILYNDTRAHAPDAGTFGETAYTGIGDVIVHRGPLAGPLQALLDTPPPPPKRVRLGGITAGITSLAAMSDAQLAAQMAQATAGTMIAIHALTPAQNQILIANLTAEQARRVPALKALTRPPSVPRWVRILQFFHLA